VVAVALVAALAMALAEQWQQCGLNNNQLKCGINCDKNGSYDGCGKHGNSGGS
jgi:hypothetical protein